MATDESKRSGDEEFHPMMPNGVMTLYNQCPRLYPGGIKEMTAQLPEIAAMGFNTVWVNPLHLTNRNPVPGKSLVHSLYAMRDHKHFNPAIFVAGDGDPLALEADGDMAAARHGEFVAKLQAYTEAARSNGLAPMFDLVLNHVGADDPIVSELDAKGLLKPASESAFPDTRSFDYSSPEKIGAAFVEFWNEFIATYVQKYGFMGARIDAIKHLPADVISRACNRLNEACQSKFVMNAITLGELLDGNFTHPDFLALVSASGLTHVNNNLHSAAHEQYRKRRGKTTLKQPALFDRDRRANAEWRGNEDWCIASVTAHSESLRTSATKFGRTPGGTVGMIGNHDMGALGVRLPETGDDHGRRLYLARERIFAISMTSDAGNYFLAGDEFLAPHTKPMVFADYASTSPTMVQGAGGFRDRWGQPKLFDLCPFIRAINVALKNCRPILGSFEVNHIVIEGVPLHDCGLVIRHTNVKGIPTDKPDIMCVTLNPAQLIREEYHATVVAAAAKAQYEAYCTEQGIDPSESFRIWVVSDDFVCSFDNTLAPSPCAMPSAATDIGLLPPAAADLEPTAPATAIPPPTTDHTDTPPPPTADPSSSGPLM